MALDPFTQALIAGGLGKMISAGGQAIGSFGAGQDLRLTPEQLDRLRELERMAATDALGLTSAEREQFRAEAMSPVQTAEREALARQAQQQQIADIGQAETFRGQQVLKGTSEAARAQVNQQVAQRDAQMAIQQQQEMERLRQQQLQSKALERQAAVSLLGGAGEAVSQVGGLKAQKAMMDDSLKKQKDTLTGAAKVTVSGAAKMLGVGADAGAGVNKEQAAIENLSRPTLGVSGPVAVEGMTKSTPSWVTQEWGKRYEPLPGDELYNPYTMEPIKNPLDLLKLLKDYFIRPQNESGE